jgi:ATP-binding cassette, subfamily B, multidrug efflux pump
MHDLKNITAVRLLLRYALPYRTALVFSLVCILVSILFRAAGPIVLQRGVDHLTGETTRTVLSQYSLLLIGIAVIQGVATFGHELLFRRSTSYIERDLRSALFDHVQKMPWEFFQKHSIGELMMRAGNDLTAAITGATLALSDLLESLVTFIIILPLMIGISAGLAALAFAPLLLVIVLPMLLQRKLKVRSERAQEYMSKVYGQAHAALSVPRMIRAFTQERQEIEAFRSASRQYIDRYLSRVRLSSLLLPLVQFFLGLTFIVVLWYGGDLVAAGKLSIGQLLQFIFYAGYIAWPMHILGWRWPAFQNGMVSMGRVHALLLHPAIRDSSTPAVLRKPAGAVQFRNVSFRYSSANSPALDQVSFQVEPGQTVGVVGTVGAGKSTLINLVPRLLEPCSGEVLIGGCPLAQIPLEALRSSIGYVPQETFLFSDTLAANLAFGRLDAGHDEICAAAEAAGLADDIAAFPKGYGTILGERGVTLSGGQKQRVSLARAILRKPDVLLLDDALSSVDSYTAENILIRLQRLMAGKTCLISSHRVSTLRGADLILVLHDGHIAERGTHHELLSYGGLYAELWEKQLLEEKLAAS